MERNRLLLLTLLCVCAAQTEDCPSDQDISHTDLSCDSDYDSHITCVWKSTSASHPPDDNCTLYAKQTDNDALKYKGSCELKPVDVSRPTLRKCSIDLNKRRGTKKTEHFQSFHIMSMDVNCTPGEQTLRVSFKPFCHIKLNPPPPPRIDNTTVSWFSQVKERVRLTSYSSQLQWRHRDQSWSEINILTTGCKWECLAELNPDELIQGETYEARVRAMTTQGESKSIWSDWSPTTSWESPIGRTKQPRSGFPSSTSAIIAVAAVLAVFLVVLRLKTDKTTWVYMVERIRGKPIPTPPKSFLQYENFQNWMGPHFTPESFHSQFKVVEFVSVEVTSSVDAVTSCGPEAALLEKIRSESSHQSNSSNFSNPSYSQLCPPPPPPPPPVSSLTAGNLAPCATDTPYGPVGGQAEVKNEDQDGDEMRGKEVEIRQLLSKGGDNSELMLVISDYEKAEKIQVERARLQSLDSGVCSGEEVSQESLEADSINVTDEGHEGEEEREAGDEADIHKLLRCSRVFDKESIQVCSGYERVQKLQADSPELPSLDSSISSEEQMSQEESLEDKSTESTSLLFPPPPPCSLPLFTPQPLNFPGPRSSPALHPSPSHLLERMALMSTDRSVEPSGDGYMSARQDQS